MKTQEWTVHKFGGSSLAQSEKIKNITKIIQQQHDKNSAIVVSAMGGTTDRLIELTELAIQNNENMLSKLDEIKNDFINTVKDLLTADRAKSLENIFTVDASELKNILHGISIIKECSDYTTALVAGTGEVWTAQIVNAVLQDQGINSCWVDARATLLVKEIEFAVEVQYPESQNLLELHIQKENYPEVLVITGFIAKNEKGVTVTLGRNGSDFSASIFGNLLNAKKINIWTDVDGVMSANPKQVPEAEVIPVLSYEEATEMAYFGANVLHLSAMTPALKKSIPLYVKNTFNPKYPGTLITANPEPRPKTPVKGFTSISNIALLNVEGAGMLGVPGISATLFDALHREGISVILISQASSEHSICLAIVENQVLKAKEIVTQAFFREIAQGKIQKVDTITGLSIMAAVGDDMAGKVGVSAKLFSAISKAGVNIHAIAQGSSERNISIIVKTSDITKALQAAHSSLYLSHQTLSVGIIGPGVVGGTFLKQLSSELENLKKSANLDVRVRAIANSKKMLLADKQINLKTWENELPTSETPMDLDQFLNHIKTDAIPHTVLIDCTSSSELAEKYIDIIKTGTHIITPNKKGGTLPMLKYQELKTMGRKYNAYFLYETTVGAGLPIIGTLKDLIQTGDEIIEIEGVLSGTLAYLFYHFDGKKPFSTIVKEAKEQGYTEPDPRDDLSGMDIVRKVVILAREIGLTLEVENVKVKGLVPEALTEVSVNEFLEKLSEYDSEFHSLIAKAKANDQILRFVGIISPKGESRVELKTYEKTHPFSRIKATDNIVAFRTKRYDDQPLIIQGPGAGPEVTAGGVFADLLRLSSNLGGN